MEPVVVRAGIASLVVGVVAVACTNSTSTSPVSTASAGTSTPAVPGSQGAGGPPGQIVFELTGGTPPFAIHEMSPEGTVQRHLLICGPLLCQTPALSPDGTRLVFSSEGTLEVANADGTNEHLLVPPTPIGSFTHPAWSPGGDRLAFIFSPGPGQTQIDVVGADGKHRHTVLKSPLVNPLGGLAWSPDGTELAFATSPKGTPLASGNIDVVAASGGSPPRTLLGHVADGVTALSWAPGPEVLFTNGHEPGIWEADGRGGSHIVLQCGTCLDFFPSWGPDGVHFAAVRNGKVVVATVNGGVQATIGPSGVSYAQWGGPGYASSTLKLDRAFSPATFVPDAATLAQLFTFKDSPQVLDSSELTVSIDWGDKTTSSGDAFANKPNGGTYYIADGTHRYASSGRYTITASVRGPGTNTLTVNLGTVFTPGVPTNVRVFPGNGKARVSWSAPADHGTSPITGYQVTATPYANTDAFADAQPVSVPATGLSKTVEGLLEDCHQEYTFTVAATNNEGESNPSPPGAAGDPSRPSPPDASGSPPHFRTSGIVDPFADPPLVAITVDGFGAHYERAANGLDPLVGQGVYQSSGIEPPVSYCFEGEQTQPRNLPHLVNTSVPPSIGNPDWHFDVPGIDVPTTMSGVIPGQLDTSGTLVATDHYLLDQVVAGGGVALPFSYQEPGAMLSGLPHDRTPSFSFPAYTGELSDTQSVDEDVSLLANEIASINHVWPNSKIVLLGHSGGGLVVEQYWEHDDYAAQNVVGVISLQAPLNGIYRAKDCVSPNIFGTFPSYCTNGLRLFGHQCNLLFCLPNLPGLAIMMKLGSLWVDQGTHDPAVLGRDHDGSFVAIGVEGDGAYGKIQMGLRFHSLIPPLVFPCEVTHDPDQINSCQPSVPPSFWSDACKWTDSLQAAYNNEDVSHYYGIVCREDVDQVAALMSGLGI